jgi:hypothetical protein
MINKYHKFGKMFTEYKSFVVKTQDEFEDIQLTI